MAGAGMQCFKASICKMNENPAGILTKKAAATQRSLRVTSAFPTENNDIVCVLGDDWRLYVPSSKIVIR